MSLKEKLNKAYKLQKQVEEVAKPMYEAWHDALAEAIDEVIKVKLNNNFPSIPIEIKFKTGEHFVIKPEYMSKEGVYRNTVWKAAGADMFSLKKIEK